MSMATVSMKLVVSHCTSVELIENSSIIFGNAVKSKNCVKTDKKDADKVTPTINRF